jgi:hypothetical protein
MKDTQKHILVEKENKKFVIFNINANNTLYSKIYSYVIRGNKKQ